MLCPGRRPTADNMASAAFLQLVTCSLHLVFLNFIGPIGLIGLMVADYLTAASAAIRFLSRVRALSPDPPNLTKIRKIFQKFFSPLNLKKQHSDVIFFIYTVEYAVKAAFANLPSPLFSLRFSGNCRTFCQTGQTGP